MTETEQREYSPVEARLMARASRGGEPLVADGANVPISRLLAAARSFAARLVADGIEKGDFVALRMANSAEYLAGALGVMFAGAVIVPVNARLTPTEVGGLLAACRPRAWVADPGSSSVLHAAEGMHAPDHRYVIDADPVRPLVEIEALGRPAPEDRAIVPIAPSDPAVVFFTAGTTGDPKGALTSHQAVTAFADIVRSALGMTDQDRVVLPMPMYYSGGLKASLANILIGARVVCFRKWHASDLVNAMGEHNGTFLWAVPSVWAIMLKSQGFEPAKVQHLRVMWRGGSHTPTTLVNDLVELFPGRAHLHSYGSTECNLAAVETDALTRPESVGLATEGTSICIDGHTEREKEGEIWLRGRQQFSGYLDTSGGGDRVTVENGWVHSGDRGWFDSAGRLRIVGRGTDVIIRGGENISAAEVERAIMRVPGVAEAAVVPVADAMFGHELKAIVVSDSLQHQDVITIEGIRDACRLWLAEFKVPKYVEIRHEALPKNAVGKIVKRDL